jgi:hypothetical protein
MTQKNDRLLTLAVVVGVSLLLARAAGAQQDPVPPEDSQAGGIPACEEELMTCDEDLVMCEDDLAQCEATRVVLPGDGAGNGAPLAYEECADGLTVADLNTGLLWERKEGFPGRLDPCLANLHLVNSVCSWTQATGAWIDALNAEGGQGFAGFSDWRVPNVKELQSIVDYGVRDPAIAPDFPGVTGLVRYWSATPTVGDIGAWWVNFQNGNVSTDLKGAAFHVRAVRSGPCSTP